MLILNSLAPRLEVPLLAQSASVEFKSDIALRGFHIDQDTRGTVVRLYVSARQADYMGPGYSIHLVDQVSGESVASRDEWADRQHGIWLLGADYRPMYRQWMDVKTPPETPANRAYWIVLTLWRKKDGGEFKRQKVLESDLQLLDDRQVVLGELVLPVVTSGWSPVPLAAFGNGFALESVDLPVQAQRGETLDVAVAWRSVADDHDNYSQFLHFVHTESGEWWVFDQLPLGPRLPTRLWYNGLADSETWQVPLPADLAPGHYEVFTGLYRFSDLKRVPVKDPNGMPWLDNRVALGSLIVE